MYTNTRSEPSFFFFSLQVVEMSLNWKEGVLHNNNSLSRRMYIHDLQSGLSHHCYAFCLIKCISILNKTGCMVKSLILFTVLPYNITFKPTMLWKCHLLLLVFGNQWTEHKLLPFFKHPSQTCYFQPHINNIYHCPKSIFTC